MLPARYLYPLVALVLASALGLLYLMQSPAGNQCVPGSRVADLKDAFEIKIVSVDNGAGVRAVMQAARDGRTSDPLSDILKAVKDGTIPRVSSRTALTVRIRGVAGPIPGQIPLMGQRRICLGMVPVRRSADGSLEIVAASDDARQGEISLLLPRALLKAAEQAEVCIEPDFLLANPIEAGRNMLCDAPNEGGLAKAAQRSKGGKFYLLIRRPSVELPAMRYRAGHDGRPPPAAT